MTNKFGPTTPIIGPQTINTPSQSSTVGENEQSNQKGKDRSESSPETRRQSVQDRILLTDRLNSNKNQNVPTSDEETKPTAPDLSKNNRDNLLDTIGNNTITNGISEGSENISTDLIIDLFNTNAFLADEHDDSNLLFQQLKMLEDDVDLDLDTRAFLSNMVSLFDHSNKEDMRKFVLMVRAEFYDCERSKRILNEQFYLFNTGNISNDIKILGNKIQFESNENKINTLMNEFQREQQVDFDILLDDFHFAEET